MNKNITYIIIFILVISSIYALLNYYSTSISTCEIPFYTPRTLHYNHDGIVSNVKSLTLNGVPAVIYQTSETKRVTNTVKSIINENLQNNSEFDHYFYDDDDCLQFIEDNFDKDVIYAYKQLIPGAYKADLWRYCILYKNGGVYMDIKFKIMSPLVKYLQRHPLTFVADVTNNYIYNAILIAPPNCNVFKLAIDQIVMNVRNKYYGINELVPTGPGLLGNIISKLEYSKYVSLYLNKNNNINLTIKDKETDEIIFESYNRYLYKNEQYIMSKKPHYGYLWRNKNIYLK